MNINLKLGDALINRVAEALERRGRPKRIVNEAQSKQKAEILAAEGNAEVAKIQTLSMIEQLELFRKYAESADRVTLLRLKHKDEITAKAIPLLSANSKPENVGIDWIFNWFDRSSTVSDEEMQTMWAKVLASEANQHGSFSKKTVNILADFDKKDAESFTKLCGFCWDIGGEPTLLIYDWGHQIYTENGVGIESLRDLEALGVVKILGDLGIPMLTLGPSGRRIEKTKARYFEKTADTKSLLPLKIFMNVGSVSLTKSGKELSRICGSTEVAGFYEYVLEQWVKYNQDPAAETHERSNNEETA